MVDAADHSKIEASTQELQSLLSKPQLEGTPVLVLGNKKDLPGALDSKQLIEQMDLDSIRDRDICCYSISCKDKTNIGQFIFELFFYNFSCSLNLYLFLIF